MPHPRRRFRCTIEGADREFMVLMPHEIIAAGYKRWARKGLHLVPIREENELYEGLEIEREGSWFEIFMYDFKQDMYFIERGAL